MTNPSQHYALTSDSSLRRLVVALTLVGALMFGARVAQAQTFNVLDNFTGGMDGSSPYAGRAWTGQAICMGRRVRVEAGMVQASNFRAKAQDGICPPTVLPAAATAKVRSPESLSARGTPYGTTYAGGVSGCSGGYGCGTVFNLRLSPTVCRAVLRPWIQTVLYRFNGGSDGANPLFGDMVFDPPSGIYWHHGKRRRCGLQRQRMRHRFRVVPHRRRLDGKNLYRFTGEGSDGANPDSRRDF